MTDAEFVFRQDVKEKSITKRSAAKTNRTGKGPVRFPSDYLSKKEREKMNSEVIGMSCKKRYSFREFKAFSDNQKVEYLTTLIKRLYPSTASFVINGLDMDLIHKIFEIFNPDNIESIDITIRSKEVV